MIKPLNHIHLMASEVFMFRIILFLFTLILSTNSYSWSSITTSGKFQTHQFLNRHAYEKLISHPLIKNGLLKIPSYIEIDKFSGVDISQNGNGPDNPELTKYSWHYYNPLIEQGKAPAATQHFFNKKAPARYSNRCF